MVGTCRRLLVVAMLAGLGVLFAPQLASANVGTTLNQCRNDASGVGDCTGSAWSNGDLNGSQTLYREGDTVPFRAILSGLGSGSQYTLRIGWDAVEGDLHAYDYLRTFDASEHAAGQDVAPCDGVAGCSGAGSTFPIPLDANTVMPDGNQQPGVFTIWGGSISAASYVSPSSITTATTGTVERQLDLTFTASGGTVVLAWGGHIASLFDWGLGETFLSNRSGAPFHMRLKQIQTPDGLESIGNQDRSMQGGAIPPAVPSFTTQVDASSIATGQTITDVATLTGSQDNGRPSGSVDFFLCGPNLTAGEDCTTGGVSVGGATVQFADAQTLTGTATKTTGAISQPGHYCFRAEYHPDDAALYTGTFHTNSTTECFDVVTPAGQLIVKKVVVNDDGGTKVASDFSFSVDGAAAVGFDTDGQNELSVPGGSTHSVTEPAVTGYATTYSNCSSVTVPAGGSATCTVTNDDRPATLVVKKVVINDDGGTKAAGDFAFKVNNGSAVAFEADGENDVTVDAGTYTVTEPAVPGYATTYSNCSDVVIANGGTATCTVTNDDRPGTLIVKKVVINDDGGTKTASDFSFQVNGAAAVAFDADGQNDLSVDAGTYSVTEPSVAGYATTYSNCSDVVVANGGTATCTVTNDDRPATLVVKKVVVNDEGGTKTAADFSFEVNGGSAVAFEADGRNDLGVAAGTYTVVEPAAAGYTATYDNCSNVVIPNGGSATCTITNDDEIAPTVEVDKTADPTSLAEPGGSVTFAVAVHNASKEAVTLTSLADDVYGDLDGVGTCDVPQQLAADDGGAGGSDEYRCSFTKTVSGNAGSTHVDTVTGTVVDDEGDSDTDDDDATVTITDVESSIEVTKTPSPSSLPEPGGDVTYTVTVKNTSAVDDVTLDADGFVDKVGDGDAEAIGDVDCAVGEGDGLPVTLEPGQSVTCTFVKAVTGRPGDTIHDVVTVTGTDDDGRDVSGSDDADVEITDVPSSIEVQKDAGQASVQAPGGDVTYTVTVTNTSTVDSVTITALTDDRFGDLDGKGTCDVPTTLAPGGSFTCQFSGHVAGSGGDTHVNVVTASGTDDDENPVGDSDDASVNVTAAPPPPHNPLINLRVTKNDLPDPVQLDGQLTYTIVVTNDGPDAATQVTAADPLPAGTTFVSVSSTQGTCANDAGLIRCSIGTLAKGASATITLVVTANRPGTLTNTVTVVGKEPESNTADNTASATTLVPAPLAPPKPQPKPVVKVKPVCSTFTVSTKALTVGTRATLVVTVKNRGKAVRGAKVVVSGRGIHRTARTGRDGKARITLTPRQAGIVTVRVPQKLACGAKRVGVVGAFEPPVTG